MSNLRLVSFNAANSAVLTASTTAGTLIAANLQTDIKSQVWRSVGTTAAITAIWPTAKQIKCALLPQTNFTNTATMRVRGYTLSSDISAVFDTGVLPCCAFTSAAIFGWDNNPAGVANFGYGGAVYAGLWFTGASVQKIIIDISDAGNAQGYVESSKLIAGDYWQPTINPNYGASIGYKDASSHIRNEAGDLLTEIKPRAKVLSLSFGASPESDRSKLMALMRNNGLSTPIFISLFPEDADKNKEQDYQIYGKLSQLSSIKIENFYSYSNSIDIEEI